MQSVHAGHAHFTRNVPFPVWSTQTTQVSYQELRHHLYRHWEHRTVVKNRAPMHFQSIEQGNQLKGTTLLLPHQHLISRKGLLKTCFHCILLYLNFAETCQQFLQVEDGVCSVSRQAQVHSWNGPVPQPLTLDLGPGIGVFTTGFVYSPSKFSAIKQPLPSFV